MKQQEVPSAAIMRSPSSAVFMPWQWNPISTGVHPVRLDEKTQEAETGTVPSPATITANKRMNNCRIEIQSTKFSSSTLHLS